MLRLTFLGTSAAAPTANRGLSGIAVRRAGELILFDCGEGSQRQMIRFGTGFDVAAICFTHFHADHYLGAIGFLRTLSMHGRKEPLMIYGPKPAKRLLETMLFQGTEPYAFPCEIREIGDGEVIQREGATITAFKTVHRTHSLGYRVAEDDRPGRFYPEKAEALGIPKGPFWRELQHGKTVNFEGRTIEPSAVVDSARDGRLLVISGDTRPCPETVQAAKGAHLLIHEATFGDTEQERALETLHSTAREAGRVAREAEAKKLILTHLSTRYDVDPSPLIAQAKAEFSNVQVAHDGLTLELEQPPG